MHNSINFYRLVLNYFKIIHTFPTDFEAIQKSCGKKVGKNSTLMTEHEPSGFGYIVVSDIPELCQPVKIYRSSDEFEDVALKFVEELDSLYNKVADRLNSVQQMIFTDNDKEQFENACICSICLKELDRNNNDNPVVRDHCHVSGAFRGAAHSNCNIKMQQQKRIIVYMHNGCGYDNHFLIKALAKKYKTSNIDVTADTLEKYRRIKTPKFLFHDSYCHLSSSLDKLSKNLKAKGVEHFPLVRKEFPDDLKFQAALQKLVFPYEYMDSFKKFDEPIPDIGKFYNTLKEEDLEEEEYERLKKVCRLFNIVTLGDLHDLYLKIDVLILASVFENYRDMGLKEYGLDPAYYISAPSFSFDAMLFKTDVELELLQEQEMYEFFEKGMRGGVSSIYNRLATSNCDKSDTYDPRINPSTLFYTGLLQLINNCICYCNVNQLTNYWYISF